jgi:hypothetical protein
VALVLVAVVLAAGAVALAISPKTGGNTTTTIPATPGTSSGPGTTAGPATTAPSAAAQAAATQLAGLLQQTNAARNLVVNATNGVAGCQEDPGDGITQLQTAISDRNAVVTGLATLPVGALPNGTQMIASLTAGLNASVTADQDYIDWMTDMSNQGTCPLSDSALQAAMAASQQATAAKQTFVGLWDPVAAQYNLTQYQEKDL